MNIINQKSLVLTEIVGVNSNSKELYEEVSELVNEQNSILFSLLVMKYLNTVNYLNLKLLLTLTLRN